MMKRHYRKHNYKWWILGGAVLILVVALGFLSQRTSKPPTASAPRVSDTPVAEVVWEGRSAPEFTLPSTGGKEVSLADYREKKNVLLYFQEGVMCDPCWKQTLDIQKEYDKFQALNTELLTITVDPLNALVKNAQRFGITLPVLADDNLKVSTAYDVLKDAMHPGSRPGHTFVLVDKSGKIIWRKAYFIASGSTKMTMDMNGQTMTMDMGMDMGTPGSVMYVAVDQLLADIKSATSQLLAQDSAAPTASMPGMDMSASKESGHDHTMCLTKIHKHADFKMYVAGAPLNLSQRQYMDQDNVLHFHPTVKVKPEDIPNVPFADMIHIHKAGATLHDFLKTLDLPFAVEKMQGLKVYANGVAQTRGLDYVMQDKDRILITDTTDSAQLTAQLNSVTAYAAAGKEKNPALFGGC